ncbi:hypothetical protein ATANTOWER_010393 [Ataeniobius toweri]|uniref:Uncharacterized protein n=1 Tax=Ataeniobius toweri TaxID=208326 RepID=A0ABU7BPF9_9TELE|nr:hypothetical protein [Ataeniobius toweri]
MQRGLDCSEHVGVKRTSVQSVGLCGVVVPGGIKVLTINGRNQLRDRKELPLQVNTQAPECWQRWVLKLLS